MSERACSMQVLARRRLTPAAWRMVWGEPMPSLETSPADTGDFRRLAERRATIPSILDPRSRRAGGRSPGGCGTATLHDEMNRVSLARAEAATAPTTPQLWPVSSSVSDHPHPWP